MLRRNESGGLFMVLVAIAVGLGGELHIPVPGMGVIAMLDGVSYVIAVPILLTNWTRMGKYMRRSLKWALLWSMAAMLSNGVYCYNLRYWMKCVAVISSSWAIMAAAYVLLRKYPKAYLWYLVGAGIGGWIALYHFRNGALEYFANKGNETGANVGIELLQDKQVYPTVVRGVLLGFVLPLFLKWRKFPFFGVLTAFFLSGVMLLFRGGSRSSFGMFCAAAGAGFMVMYGKSTLKRIAKSPVFFSMVIGVAVLAMFGAYKFMATTGTLGGSEKIKYEREFDSGKGVLDGRAGFGAALDYLKSSCGIGMGGMLRCHSVMMNSMACEGILGFLFWIYFYLQVLWWVCRRLPYSGPYSAFICLMVLMACWDVFGSPFGTRHKFFVLMAFISLCRDSKFYGVGSLFDESLLRSRLK